MVPGLRAPMVKLGVLAAAGVGVGLWRQGDERLGVLQGVALGVATAVWALRRKVQALKVSLQAAMGTVLGVLMVRLLCVAAVLVALRKRPEALHWFVGAFFVAYVVAQYIEVKFLLDAGNRGSVEE